ncbi:MAG: hypothetical protein WKF30_02375 [Pyrinomonadaceae bacterium]
MSDELKKRLERIRQHEQKLEELRHKSAAKIEELFRDGGFLIEEACEILRQVHATQGEIEVLKLRARFIDHLRSIKTN